MVKLEFEDLSYSPTDHLEPMIIVQVPEKGRLTQFPYKVYLEEVVAEKSRIGQQSGRFFSGVELSHDLEKIMMLWIEERSEWIALVCIAYERKTPHAQGGKVEVWGYSPPYELNDYCKRRLLQAYGLSETDIPLERIAITSPGDLIKVAKNG